GDEVAQQGFVLGHEWPGPQYGERRIPLLAVLGLLPELTGDGQPLLAIELRRLGHTANNLRQAALLDAEVRHLRLHVFLHVRRLGGVGHLGEGGVDLGDEHATRLGGPNWLAQPTGGRSSTSSVRRKGSYRAGEG